MASRDTEFLNKISINATKQELIGQREGLELALDLTRMQERTLENMIATVNKSLNSLEV